MNCRHCHSPLSLPLIDLGSAPPSNAYLTAQDLLKPEVWYPLRLLVCESCWLVQTADVVAATALFNPDYAYFSSTSVSWMAHAARYAETVIRRFGLNDHSLVVEVAANDGHLLRNFLTAGIPCLGIEPTAGTAAAAEKLGLAVRREFFDTRLARQLVQEGQSADLMVANNVLAHVPDINDFVRGFDILLKPDGVATFEFPHLMRLIAHNQFDTIYHEHFSYLSFTTVVRIFQAGGLAVFDVEELTTHGGSLRVYVQRAETGRHEVSLRVSDLVNRETTAGMRQPDYYQGFQEQANRVKNDFLGFLLDARKKGFKVGGYGAAAKGNTLLNFAGVRPDLLPWIADRNPAKQGQFMPGSRIPVVHEDVLKESKPDFVVILPWNIKDEIMAQLSYIRKWKGAFVTAVPSLEIC